MSISWSVCIYTCLLCIYLLWCGAYYVMVRKDFRWLFFFALIPCLSKFGTTDGSRRLRVMWCSHTSTQGHHCIVCWKASGSGCQVTSFQEEGREVRIPRWPYFRNLEVAEILMNLHRYVLYSYIHITYILTYQYIYIYTKPADAY